MARALFLLPQEHPVRQALRRLCKHELFDAFILVVIVGNACMMAMEDPTNEEAADGPASGLDLACNVVFTIELCLKVCAYGFIIGDGTYMRNGWNVLDFVIVISSWLPYVVGSDSGTSALRTFRVLRPLRTISRFTGLKNLVVTIFMAAPQLQLLLIVVALFFVTFGVVAIQLWKGKFRQRCQEPEGISQYCSVGGTNATELCSCALESNNCGGAFCDLLDPQSCSSGLVCAEAPWNPYYDFASFDHIFASWVIVLQCITTTSWQDVMHKSQATTGVLSSIYYLLIVMSGAYFLLNLFVAVIKEKFSIATSVMNVSEALFAEIDDSGDGLLDKEEINTAFISKGITLSTEELDACFGQMDADGSGEIDSNEFAWWLRSDYALAQQMRRRLDVMAHAAEGESSSFTEEILAKMNDPATPAEDRARIKLDATLKGNVDMVQLFQFHDRDESGELSLRQFKALLRRDAGIVPAIMSDAEITTAFAAVDLDNGGGIDVDEFMKWLSPDTLSNSTQAADTAVAQLPDDSHDQHEGADSRTRNGVEDEEIAISGWQQWLQDVVESFAFSSFFVFLIIVNTVVLASDHHGIAKETEEQLETINLWLTLIFTVEMLMKIAAYQKRFHKDGFNVFDSFVVTAGIIELTIDSNTMGVFRVFRMLRLLRVLRLISFLKPLRTIARVIVVTTSGLTYIGFLLSLFMFIFAICGMQLFGGEFFFPVHGKPLWNFDTFPIAFMTCFQILNYDTWDWVMLDGMRAIGWGASFYFILWIVVGALVLRNLLLVIILETYVIVAKNILHEDGEELVIDESDPFSPTVKRDSMHSDGGSPDKDSKETDSATSSGFKQRCAVVAESETTDNVVLTCILLNCVTMSIDTPDLDPNSDLAAILYWSGAAFTVIFTAEAAVKMIAHGVYTPATSAYLASGWNRLDFIILVVAWADLLAESANVGALKALRALRTLRILNKIQGLRVLVLALVDAVSALTNVAGLTFIMWLIFGICCVNYLKGALWSCTDASEFVFGRDTCTGTYVMEGTVTARSWANSESNFDNIGNALFTLFEISMGQWHHIAHSAIDAVGIDIQPRSGYNQWWTLPFMLFVLMSNLFFMSLFVGVIYDKYFHRKYAGLEELSKEQRDFLAIMQMISSRTFVPERVPDNSGSVRVGYRSTCYAIATSPNLDNLILGSIIANCALMASTFYGEPQWWADTQFWLNQTFTLIFTFECAVKIIGFGWDQYWIDSWNKFDLMVVAGSWLDVVVTLLEVQFVSAALFRIVRVARVIGRLGRLFKGLKVLQGIDAITNTFIESLPALSYITLFITLEIFIFAVIAMNLFGRIKFNSCLNEDRNFKDVPTGMLTLFGIATKDASVCMVHACMLQTDCNAELGECGDRTATRIFYILFDFTIMVTTIEMFVNVILAKYEDLSELDALPITAHHLNAFRDAWKTVDPDATCWASGEDIQRVIDKLPRQLGFDELSGEDALQMDEMRLPNLPDGEKGGFLKPSTDKIDATVDEGAAEKKTPSADEKTATATYNFYEVLYGLIDRKCGVPLPADNKICKEARLRMCLQTPSLRNTAKARAKAQKLISQTSVDWFKSADVKFTNPLGSFDEENVEKDTVETFDTETGTSSPAHANFEVEAGK